MYSSCPPDPSAPSSKPRKPPSGTRSSTTAPAPSPKSTHVLRSSQSTTLRQDVSADDERVVGEAARDHRVRLHDRVDEAGTAGGQVVGGRVLRAEAIGEDRARRRKEHVRA